MDRPIKACCARGRLGRGFTLIEMTLVIGIVGTILAGLFAAAGVARYRAELNMASNELNLIVGNMRQLYASRNPATVSAAGFGTAAMMALATQGVYPGEMLNPDPGNATPCLGTVANHSWNIVAGGCRGTVPGSVSIRIVTANFTKPQFNVRFTGLPQDACEDLIANNSLPGNDTKLNQIVVTPSAGGVSQTFSQPPVATAANGYLLPVSPIQAATACTSANANATYTVDWYYTLFN